MLQGHATFELDGERVDAPAGTFVYVAPTSKRTAFAEEPGTTIVAVGGTPGKAYEPFGWEIWRPIHHLYEAGDYAEAAQRGRELAGAHPEYPLVLYNVACCESLAGDGRSHRAPPARDRPLGPVPLACRRGLRLRSDPRRPGVQGAGGLDASAAPRD